ncbi:hypothetical protein SeMB42_g05433 [Synchytrium endobioticum]|uniref:NAD(P)-binding domain-containing protein n=1 Tax=Synchytrium endobioticum TaxID=286115 RepID=A0A507CRF9_9FUNG|nr:hypothetical protein SeMB42_g05433 [Synchytrium endobioticum]TPX44331.1 hypothetical protein SeLEV6574_g04551 [Synchytrium endobioticum]
MAKSAIIIGGSGLVGRRLVESLLQDANVSRVVSLGRREVHADQVCPTCTDDQKAKFLSVVVDFLNLSKNQSDFEGHDVGFITLGTTYKDAGSNAEKFREIDYAYCLNFAKLYQLVNSSRPTHICLLTSGGSNPGSFFLYPRTKGELERDCANIGLNKLTIFRPGLLVPASSKDTRFNSERSGESVALKILPYVNWIVPTHLSSSTTSVGIAMWKKGMESVSKGAGSTTVEILENKDIRQIAPIS